ncbi:GNAT family N-acetyltransferase [Romboutsia sp.]|uniref:GNAT family N-acetyltransferase n=1 Tax=Romboutsia sp. TaxID=1965302 RepID=UPI003F37A60D
MIKSKYPQMKTVDTGRFILRPAKLSDANDMFEYYSQEKVVRYLPTNPHKNILQTRVFIRTFFLDNYKKGKVGHLAIVEKESNKVIGNIGLNNVYINAKEAEIGICINPSYWGNDIATELTIQSLKYGFEYLNVEKLIALTYEDNKRTRKSLENLGFKYVETYNKKISKGIESKVVRCDRFELLREDYFKSK